MCSPEYVNNGSKHIHLYMVVHVVTFLYKVIIKPVIAQYSGGPSNANRDHFSQSKVYELFMGL